VTSRGVVGEDGSVVLMTDARGTHQPQSGALVGPHSVSILAPRTQALTMSPQDDWMSDEEKATLKEELDKMRVYEPLECGTLVDPNQVEVSRGGNEFTFTLSGAPPRPSAAPKRGPSD
jgi:hypothetical protein